MRQRLFHYKLYTANYILFIDNFLDDADGFFQFIPGDVERRQEAQEAVGREDEDAVVDAAFYDVHEGFILECDADHEPHAGYVVDVFALFQFFFDVFPFFPDFFHEGVVEAVDDGNAAGRTNRVAAEGRTMGMVGQGMLRRIGEHRSPQGQAAADGFSRRNNIGLDAVAHVGIEIARPAVTGLDFVDDDQDIVGMRIFCDLLDVFLVEGMDAAFALDHFHHDGTDVIFFAEPLHIGKIIGFGIDEAVDEGAKVFMERVLAASRQGGNGPAVEAVLQGDDGVAAVAVFVVRILAGRLDGTFVGFGTGVREEDLLHARLLAEFFGQDGLGFRKEDVGNMAQFMELRFNGFDPHVVTDAEVVDGNTGAEVDVFLAVHIIQNRAFAVVQYGTDPVVYIDDIFFIKGFIIFCH